ncbi:MAG: hypothetical protein AAF539_13130 [Planctomycetota bacterium]
MAKSTPEPTTGDQTLVTVKPNWGKPFHRTIRDKDDKPIGHYRFEVGVATPVQESDIDTLMKDMGNSLVIARLDEFDRVKVDWDSTKEIVALRDGTKDADVVDPASVLVKAGLDAKVAGKLVENAAKIPEPRLASPDGVIAFVEAGNSIEKECEGLGEAAERKILEWIKSVKEKEKESVES